MHETGRISSIRACHQVSQVAQANSSVRAHLHKVAAGCMYLVGPRVERGSPWACRCGRVGLVQVWSGWLVGSVVSCACALRAHTTRSFLPPLVLVGLEPLAMISMVCTYMICDLHLLRICGRFVRMAIACAGWGANSLPGQGAVYPGSSSARPPSSRPGDGRQQVR